MAVEEHRFAVGTEEGKQSSVWKLWARPDGSIYLVSRMMGSDTKVSFHPNGRCQWSRTDEWVRKNLHRGVRNADRHIFKWERSDPGPMAAALTFRLIVPASELRKISGETRLDKVQWLPTPQSGEALAVECYFTPPMSREPSPTEVPNPPLVMWRLPDQRWFVAVFHTEVVTPENAALLSETRATMARVAKQHKVPLLPTYRAVAFLNKGDRGMIEMVPFGGTLGGLRWDLKSRSVLDRRQHPVP